MGGSLRIARIFGIDLKIHFTFLLVILIGATNGAATGRGLPGAALGVLSVLLLFACVTLHEFGHALVAQRLGVGVREITLFPIGGVAHLARSPSKARDELLIAVAGPLVNVVILVVLFPLLAIVLGGVGPAAELVVRGVLRLFRVDLAGAGPMPAMSAALSILVSLNIANLMLILFNMVPAFPLDGGRVLRAVLWMRMPMPWATRIASRVGQGLAVVMGVFAFMTGQWIMLFIAVLIYFTAGAESAAVQGGTVLATRRVGDAYNKFALALTIDDRVSRVIDYILTSYQPDFAVVHKGALQGVVTRDDVLKWLSVNNYDVYVTEVMRETVPRVDARMPLDEVVQRLADADERLAAVYDGERFLGLVSGEDIAEAQLVLTFLQRGPAAGAPTQRHIRRPRPASEPIV